MEFEGREGRVRRDDEWECGLTLFRHELPPFLQFPLHSSPVRFVLFLLLQSIGVYYPLTGQYAGSTRSEGHKTFILEECNFPNFRACSCPYNAPNGR